MNKIEHAVSMRREQLCPTCGIEYGQTHGEPECKQDWKPEMKMTETERAPLSDDYLNTIRLCKFVEAMEP